MRAEAGRVQAEASSPQSTDEEPEARSGRPHQHLTCPAPHLAFAVRGALSPTSEGAPGSEWRDRVKDTHSRALQSRSEPRPPEVGASPQQAMKLGCRAQPCTQGTFHLHTFTFQDPALPPSAPPGPSPLQLPVPISPGRL